jgi:hypothetical protein
VNGLTVYTDFHPLQSRFQRIFFYFFFFFFSCFYCGGGGILLVPCPRIPFRRLPKPTSR